MKKIETIEKVELTTGEVKNIVEALHFQWRTLQDQYDTEIANGKEPEDTYAKRSELKKLRNDFAALINTHFCGVDA